MDFNLLATWISDGWLDAARIVGITAAAYVIAMWVAAVVWTYRDIRARTNDETLRLVSVLLVAVFSVPGVLLYLALRPPRTIQDAYAMRMEEEAFARELQQTPGCPDCGRAVRDEFRNCPYCRAVLASRCSHCDRAMQTSWVMCPYCTTERESQRAASRLQPQPAMGRREVVREAPRPTPRPQPVRG